MLPSSGGDAYLSTIFTFLGREQREKRFLPPPPPLFFYTNDVNR